MRISRLAISNFRAISSVVLEDLSDVVVIAGPNGSGKSCVFDAIRLLKSAYGGYQPNELDAYFGEFQINVNQRQEDLLAFLQDPAKELRISAEFQLANDEITYLLENLVEIISAQFWRETAVRPGPGQRQGIATQMREYAPALEQKLQKLVPLFRDELKRPTHPAEFCISPSASPNVTPSLVLEHIFSLYIPHHLGVIEHHGANRNYGREQIGGVNLNIEAEEQRQRQHALSGAQDKFANLKSAMASAFVRELLQREAGGKDAEHESLIDTLKELFRTFFPGKQFGGVIPTKEGKLTFPVSTPLGTSHDVNDLSSGEKEVLYGYLRLRNTAPRNSVLLIDEPELHLNPRLISGLAGFYHRHLGRAFGNQLWLLTHSDTLMRESVGLSGFGVFHMQPAGLSDGPNQATAIAAKADIDRVVIDLVGDLAAYRPAAKVVLLEGGGDTEFDAVMITALFPDFAARVNLVSAGNRSRVRDLHDLLERAGNSGGMGTRFYSITDSDWDKPPEGVAFRYAWDVYHIENYLLNPEAILGVTKSLTTFAKRFRDASEILSALFDCARQVLPYQVRHRLQNHANKLMRDALDTGFDPKSSPPLAPILSAAVKRSIQRVIEIQHNELAERTLLEVEARFTHQAEGQLHDGTWTSLFPGREVLARFAGQHLPGLGYPAFRDLVVDRMRTMGGQPRGMARVFESILADGSPAASRADATSTHAGASTPSAR